MNPMWRIPSKRDSLFVEGPDDGAVVNALFKKRFEVDIAPPARRIVKDGVGVERAIDLFKDDISQKKPDTRIGLLIDRDGIDGKPDRWNSVRSILTAQGFAPPEQPSPGGWLHQPADLAGTRIGVWLMPDNVHPGDLETFLHTLVPQDHILWKHAQQATADAPESPERFAAKDTRKATLHAWTAWLSEPGGGYGLALQRGNLLADDAHTEPLLAWLRQLFLEP